MERSGTKRNTKRKKATPEEAAPEIPKIEIVEDCRPDARLTDDRIVLFELLREGLKQSQVARVMGVAKATLSRWVKDAEMRTLYEEYRKRVVAAEADALEQQALQAVIENGSISKAAKALGIERRQVFNFTRRKGNRELLVDAVAINTQVIRNRAVDASFDALEALVDIAKDASNEPDVRVKAADAILKRGLPDRGFGVTVATQVNTGTTSDEDRPKSVQSLIETSELDDEGCHDIAEAYYRSRQRKSSKVIEVEAQEAS